MESMTATFKDGWSHELEPFGKEACILESPCPHFILFAKYQVQGSVADRRLERWMGSIGACPDLLIASTNPGILLLIINSYRE